MPGYLVWHHSLRSVENLTTRQTVKQIWKNVKRGMDDELLVSAKTIIRDTFGVTQKILV